MQEYLEIGQIVNTTGLKGYVKITPFTDDIKRFDKLKTIYVVIKGNLKEFIIEDVRYQKNLVLLKLEGVDTVEEAEKYRDCYIKIDRKDAVKLPKDTYFIVDLIGVDVITTDGNLLGKIEDVFPTGSNDVYVVKDNLGKQVLLPAIAKVVKKVDLENKQVIVELIPGLI